MHVLIVEDSQEIADLFRLLLQLQDVTVTVWTSDFPSLAASVDWASIDAVLCDQFLADYDGKELLRWLDDHHPRIRRVMLTADAMVDSSKTSAHELLIKPAPTSVLLKALGVGHE